MTTLKKITAFFIFLFYMDVHAKNFKNAYISFDMIDNWTCAPSQTEWVCRSQDPKESKEAVIVLTAKEKGPTDSFDQYQSHVNSPISSNGRGGPLTSRVVYQAQQNRYNDQTWLDSLHQDSEVKNFFTRYLATIKEPIAILVTFSAHNSVYAKYSGHFMNTIKSLRVIASNDILKSSEARVRPGNGEIFGQGASGIPPDMLGEDDTQNKKSFLTKETLLGLGILILAILLYAGYKLYSKKN